MGERRGTEERGMKVRRRLEVEEEGIGGAGNAGGRAGARM